MTELRRDTAPSDDGRSVGAASGGAIAASDARQTDDRWPSLPATVRTLLVEIAGRVLGTLDAKAMPPLLARVARFTPAKRGRAGAAPLARALAEDAGFRAMVASALAPDFGRPGGDPVAVAARAYLTGTDDLAAAVARVSTQDEAATLRARVADLAATVETLTARLARATAADDRDAEIGRAHV